MDRQKAQVRRVLRQVEQLEYGFGPETMRIRKICPACGKGNFDRRTKCLDCGAALPETTLLDFYRSRHRCCPGCGIVVTDTAVYCTVCGRRLPKVPD